MIRAVIIVCLLYGTGIYGTERYDSTFIHSDNALQPGAYHSELTLYSSNKEFTGDTEKPLLAKRDTGSRQEKKKSPFRRLLLRYKEQLIVSGIGLGALITSGIFNAAARSQYEEEQDLYDTYLSAEKGSDFDKLWNEYKEAKNKTDVYLNLRGAFGLTASAIGVSLVIAFAIEKDF